MEERLIVPVQLEKTDENMDFNAYIEQDYPFKCPECLAELTMHDAIGTGEYPSGGLRSMSKPNCKLAVGFECPKCFAKSCFHDNGTFKSLYEDYKLIKLYKDRG